ncbi:MAG: hypothetical protein SFU27_04160 [Thermonemataceae bacterium]|nr:hypothetical protein [Thermonemataceae bacterium]
MKKILTLAFSVSFCINIFAQQVPNDAIGYYQDALIFAQPTSPMGSARVQALAGANVAIGADVYATASNPAGLGLLKRGQFNMGLAFSNLQSQANYIDTDTNNGYSYLKFNNIGFAIPISEGNAGEYKGGSVAVSVMRTNNYQRELSYEGLNLRSTLADRFTLLADGIDANILENEAATGEILDLASLAYANYVINPYTDDSTAYYTEFRDINDNLVAPIRQRETMKVKGGETTFHISYGGNYADKLFFGFGMGIATLRYKLSSTYQENLSKQAADGELQEFSLQNNRTTTGGGVNFNFGLIYRPINAVRIGASIATPTFYALQEKDENTMTATSVGFSPVSNATIPSEFNFTYSSPLRINTGLAIFIKKYGFITAEAEWVDYAGMSLSAEDATLDADKKAIGALYTSAFNFRGGAEIRINSFRLRAGTAYYQSAFKDNFDGAKREIWAYSGGLGLFLNKSFSLDFSMTYTPSATTYTPYTLPNSDYYYSVSSKNRQITGMLSASLFF